jgi:hypothetical protein
MAHSAKFASGKYAWAMCDVCGIRCKYRELRETTIRGLRTGTLACQVCWDPDHPQNFLSRYITTDAQALRHARPDTGLQASRQLYPPGNWINGRPPMAFRE